MHMSVMPMQLVQTTLVLMTVYVTKDSLEMENPVLMSMSAMIMLQTTVMHKPLASIMLVHSVASATLDGQEMESLAVTSTSVLQGRMLAIIMQLALTQLEVTLVPATRATLDLEEVVTTSTNATVVMIVTQMQTASTWTTMGSEDLHARAGQDTQGMEPSVQRSAH